MMQIGIAAVANQTFFVQLEEIPYNITLHAADDVVAVSITRDDVVLVQGSRVMPGVPLLPYRYQERGNFLLLTDEGDLADFTQFGVTQFLVYLTPAELAEFRGA